MRRINVIGTSASGKSTFSKTLAHKLNLSYIELDDLFWLDNWQESTNDAFLNKLQYRIDQAPQGYVIDGNYSRTQSIKWKNIDTIIWLDFPFHVNLYRSVKRALQRVVSKQKLWPNSNNKESFRMILTRDSIIWWMIKTHKENQQKYLAIMNQPEYAHIRFIHLRSSKQSQQFLDEIYR